MDRLETIGYIPSWYIFFEIYIPVWIDQKPVLYFFNSFCNFRFTFQYGQIRNLYTSYIFSPLSEIYIPVWIDQKPHTYAYAWRLKSAFTFQYGQIRNCVFSQHQHNMIMIYIPVWIDQKLDLVSRRRTSYDNLHSSMDRLET